MHRSEAVHLPPRFVIRLEAQQPASDAAAIAVAPIEVNGSAPAASAICPTPNAMPASVSSAVVVLSCAGASGALLP
jgi:hypothetical protein